MTLESNWANTTDVVRSHYGARPVDNSLGGQVSTSDHEKVINLTWDLGQIITGAPTTSNDLVNPATGEMEAFIPAYSRIVSCVATVVEALSTTGGSAAADVDLLVGLDKYSDGTAEDADGLIAAAQGDVTIASNDIAEARGVVYTGAGADIATVIAVATQPTATLDIDDITGMTAIAGKIACRIVYVPEQP